MLVNGEGRLGPDGHPGICGSISHLDAGDEWGEGGETRLYPHLLGGLPGAVRLRGPEASDDANVVKVRHRTPPDQALCLPLSSYSKGRSPGPISNSSSSS